MDNNVHPAGTIRLTNALIQANRRFDRIIIPGRAHGYAQYQPSRRARTGSTATSPNTTAPSCRSGGSGRYSRGGRLPRTPAHWIGETVARMETAPRRSPAA
jgi:hypothetical protein